LTLEFQLKNDPALFDDRIYAISWFYTVGIKRYFSFDLFIS